MLELMGDPPGYEPHRYIIVIDKSIGVNSMVRMVQLRPRNQLSHRP